MNNNEVHANSTLNSAQQHNVKRRNQNAQEKIQIKS